MKDQRSMQKKKWTAEGRGNKSNFGEKSKQHGLIESDRVEKDIEKDWQTEWIGQQLAKETRLRKFSPQVGALMCTECGQSVQGTLGEGAKDSDCQSFHNVIASVL